MSKISTRITGAVLGLVAATVLYELQLAAQSIPGAVSMHQVQTVYSQDGSAAESTAWTLYLNGLNRVKEEVDSHGVMHRKLTLATDGREIHVIPQLGIKMTTGLPLPKARDVAKFQRGNCGAGPHRKAIQGYEVYGRENVSREVGENGEPNGVTYRIVHWHAPALACLAIEREETRVLPDGSAHLEVALIATAIDEGAPDEVFVVPDYEEVSKDEGQRRHSQLVMSPEAYAAWLAEPTIARYLDKLRDAYYNNRTTHGIVD